MHSVKGIVAITWISVLAIATIVITIVIAMTIIKTIATGVEVGIEVSSIAGGIGSIVKIVHWAFNKIIELKTIGMKGSK